MATPILPRAQSSIVDRAGFTTREWYDFFRALLEFVGDNQNIATTIQGILARLTALEDDDTGDFLIQGLGSIQVNGTPANGVVQITLEGDQNSPGVRYRYGTGADGLKAWARLYDDFEAGIGLVQTDSGYIVLGEVETAADLPPTGNPGEAWRVLEIEDQSLYAWDGTAFVLDTATTGVIGFRLAELANSGLGIAPVQIYNRDAYGRIEGDQDADTDDLPEGATNLYFTNARADARITVQKGQPLGLATLDGSGKLDAGQLPALAITETFVVASQVTMLALTAQEGDVAVRTDLNKSFILTAAPASALGNWQELLTPTSAVSSVFGRVGAVVAGSGDYTPAQVGAEPAFVGGTTAQYRRGDKTWQGFATDVRAAMLAGLSTASSVAITVADTVLSALGKLQAQITGLADSKLNVSAVSSYMLTLLDDADDITARDTLQAMPLKLVVSGRNADFTYASTDANVATGKTTGTARVYTVDASQLIVGAYYYAANYSSAGSATVSAAAGTTIRLSGTATTGNRTVGPFSLARIWIRSATEAWVDGPGVT